MNLKVLKNKNLVLVILGQFVSGFGTFIQSFALSLYVLKKTGSAALFSSVLAVSIIPYVLLTPVAGVIADRFSRKKMIVIMDILSSVAVAAFCAVFAATGELSMAAVYILVLLLSSISAFFNPSISAIIPDIVEKDKLADANSIRQVPYSLLSLISPLAAVYILVLLLSSISAFFNPSISAIIPDIVEKDKLADANSIRQVPYSLLSLISPLAGGLLFGLFGLLPIMIINAVSFFSSAISEMFIKIEKETLQEKKEGDTYFSSFKQGLGFIRKMPEIMLMICVAIVANFVLSPIFSVALPVVMLQDFKITEQLYGLFNSLSTLGLLLAPVLAAKIIKKYHYSKLLWSIVAFDGILAVIIAVLSINGIFPHVMINFVSMIIVMNILIGTVIWVNLALSTAMQLIVPGDMLGRVSSVISTFALIAMPLGTALMGSLLEVGKSYMIMGIYAAMLVVVGLLARLGFSRLEKSGKMDVTVGLEKKEEAVPENA